MAAQDIATLDPALQEREALLRQVKRLNALHRIHLAAASTLDLGPMLETVVTTVAEVMHGDACSIYLHDEECASLVLSAAFGLTDAAVGRQTLPIGEGMAGLAAAERRIIATPDAAAHPA